LLVGIVLVAFVYRRSHKIMRENIEEEAEEAREVLMPQTTVNDYGAMDAGQMSPTQENRGRRM
jgi:hypothetical protein